MSTCTHLAAKKLQQFELVGESSLSQTGLPFDEALPESLIEQAAEEERVDFGGFADDQREAIYTPAVALRAFLSQMLHANEQRACLTAVARVAVLLDSPPCDGLAFWAKRHPRFAFVRRWDAGCAKERFPRVFSAISPYVWLTPSPCHPIM